MGFLDSFSGEQTAVVVIMGLIVALFCGESAWAVYRHLRARRQIDRDVATQSRLLAQRKPSLDVAVPPQQVEPALSALPRAVNGVGFDREYRRDLTQVTTRLRSDRDDRAARRGTPGDAPDQPYRGGEAA